MSNNNLALDISLEKARALHRVWRALNDGDCPNCHRHRPATEMFRWRKPEPEERESTPAIACPDCRFYVTHEEIQEIERMFAPAMNSAVAIFRQWRAEREVTQPLLTEND